MSGKASRISGTYAEPEGSEDSLTYVALKGTLVLTVEKWS